MYQCTAMQKTTAKRKRVHETDDESVNDCKRFGAEEIEEIFLQVETRIH